MTGKCGCDIDHYDRGPDHDHGHGLDLDCDQRCDDAPFLDLDPGSGLYPDPCRDPYHDRGDETSP